MDDPALGALRTDDPAFGALCTDDHALGVLCTGIIYNLEKINGKLYLLLGDSTGYFQ